MTSVQTTKPGEANSVPDTLTHNPQEAYTSDEGMGGSPLHKHQQPQVILIPVKVLPVLSEKLHQCRHKGPLQGERSASAQQPSQVMDYAGLCQGRPQAAEG